MNKTKNNFYKQISHPSELNHHQFRDPIPVLLHLNKPGHSINDVRLIPLELIRNNRDVVRKASYWEAHFNQCRGKTRSTLGIRRDEARWYVLLSSYLHQSQSTDFIFIFPNPYL